MSRPRAYFSLVSYADSAFAIGGHDGAELNTMERLSRGDGWVARANLPYGNHGVSMNMNINNSMHLSCCYGQVLHGG